jgi:hypothetical protein
VKGEPRGKNLPDGCSFAFETKPIAFALRDVVPGTDLASVAQPGIGAAIWRHATNVQASRVSYSPQPQRSWATPDALLTARPVPLWRVREYVSPERRPGQ